MKCLLPIFFVIVLLTACEDLPKPTSSGEQTFGCRIDGKRWVPIGSYGGAPPILAATIRANSGDQLTISAYLGDQMLTLDLNQPILRPGKYVLGKVSYDTGNYGSFEVRSDGTQSNRWYTDSLHTGEVTLTRIDPTNKVVSGTFFFTVYDRRAGHTITIEDGRFDLNYKPH